MNDDRYDPSSTEEWYQARRTAFVRDILGVFTQRPTNLLPFDEVQQKLQLRVVNYLGLRDVPLDHIVGSVGRDRDFTRAFFPRQDELRDRWRRINQLITVGSGVPPVELYKVGQTYFVRDGNHRVSVARHHDFPSIEAYVWEYKTRATLEPDTNVDDLLCKAAHAVFLERTNVDRLCPDLNVELTQPDGYDDLLYEIEVFQQSLSKIDERQVPFDEAVALWGEMHYDSVVEIIRQRDILRDFPGRKEGDLYLWLRRNQEELQLRYTHQVLVEEAADDLAKRFGDRPTPTRQVKKAAGWLVEGVGELSGRLAGSITTDSPAQENSAVAAALMNPVRRVSAGIPPHRFQGKTLAEWKTWRAELRMQLWDLLGVDDLLLQQAQEPNEVGVEIEERVLVKGDSDEYDVWRELVWLDVEQDERGLRVPAYLFLPSQITAPRPAVVIFPGHGTISQVAGLEKSPQRASGLEMARAGFVTLAVEPRGFGRLDAIEHLQIDAVARLLGRTWYGLLVQDGMRAIDYLLTRPEVEATRIGAAGLGAGGALTLYVAALDNRVQVALISAYLGKYIISTLEEEHCPCFNIPGILRCAEMGDIAALIAPRPVLFVNGQRDPSVNSTARDSFSIVSHVYRLLGMHRRAKLIEPVEMGHYFDHQLACGWFRRWLVQDQEIGLCTL